MIFKTYNTETVARVFFNGYSIGSLFLALIAFYGGLASGAGVLSTLSGFLYIVVVSLLTLNKRFRKSPFSVLLCFFTFLYLNIPAAFILVKGNDYIYGSGLESIPFVQSDYRQSLPWGFLYLSAFWIAMWLGIITPKTKSLKINQTRFSSIKLKYMLLLGIVVLVITWIDNQGFAAFRLEGTEKENSLRAFIFFDHAFLSLAGLLLFFNLNKPKHLVNSREITMLMSAIFIGFTSLHFMGGSKAAILVIFTLLVLYPFCFLREYPHAMCSFPTPKLLVFLALLAPPLFYLALMRRISLSTGLAPDLRNIIAFTEFDASLFHFISDHIFYRFSQGGIDRFLLIFQSFVINPFDSDISMEFINYLAKNTLNLIMPGTPFPESYAPSSQLFPQVIQYHLTGGDTDSSAFLTSMNTQPYTLFGVFMIVFGFIAPIVMYLSTFLFVFIYRRFNNIFIKLTMLYFFSGALSSYGIESVLGNSVHFLVSISLMYLLIKALSLVRLVFSVKSKRIPSPATT